MTFHQVLDRVPRVALLAAAVGGVLCFVGVAVFVAVDQAGRKNCDYTVESRYKKFVRQWQAVSYIEIFLILVLWKNPS